MTRAFSGVKCRMTGKGIYILLRRDAAGLANSQLFIPRVARPIYPQIFLTALFHVTEMAVSCELLRDNGDACAMIISYIMDAIRSRSSSSASSFSRHPISIGSPYRI